MDEKIQIIAVLFKFNFSLRLTLRRMNFLFLRYSFNFISVTSNIIRLGIQELVLGKMYVNESKATKSL